MKLLYLLILLINLLGEANAQQVYFNKRYDFNQSPSNGFDILPYDSGYIEWSSITLNPYGNLMIGVSFLDSAGNLLQTKVYGNPAFNTFLGGPGNVCKTSDGGYAIAGSVEDSSSNGNVVLYKFNHNGDTSWTHIYNDTSWQSGWQCKQTRDKGFIITGQTFTYDPNGDVLLIKTDSLGNLQWQNHYGGAGTDLGESIDTCFDGGYAICGNTTSYGVNAGSTFPNCYLIKTDRLGNFQWQQVFGGPYGDDLTGVIQAADSSIIVGGEFAIYDPNQTCCDGENKPYIVKLDLSGNVIWQKTYGDSLLGIGLDAIKELPNGDIIGGGGGYEGSPNFINTGLVVKVNSSGDSIFYRNYISLGLHSDSYFYDISYDKDHGYICTGSAGPLAPDTGTQDVWVLKLDSNGCEVINCLGNVGINEPNIIIENIMNIYPNPSNGLFYIKNKAFDEVTKTEVFNYIGEMIFFKEGRTEEIDLSNAASGIYFYSIKSKVGKVLTGKIVKE